MRSLMWFRNDLRVEDNTALHYAGGETFEHTIGVYYITPVQWRQHDMAACKVDFILGTLEVLESRLAKLGIPLLVYECDEYEDIAPHLSSLCQELGIESVFANHEYAINERRRDETVGELLNTQGISFKCFHDFVIHPPGSLRTQQGGYYKVFSQFKRQWLKHLTPEHYQEYFPPRKSLPRDLPGTGIPQQVDGYHNPIGLRDWPPGEDMAQERIKRFGQNPIFSYQSQRDYPAHEGTSGLSPYLAIGALSPRAALRRAMYCNYGELDSGDEGVLSWINELIWREFYQHILFGYPHVSMHRPFQPHTEDLRWRQAPEDLQAWQEGRTGIPIVDAAMRQLNQTGWMHNRLRMVVAMFLSKNLLIDWREGERYFMQHLIDGEIGANNGGWQWAASTGTDAAPYFRVFNPVAQSQRFDPDGDFIRRYVPELSHLDNKQIHEPWKQQDLLGQAVDYPVPIVDLKLSRQLAIEAFKQLPTRE